MAVCKMCGRTIPDGYEYCEECEQKIKNQADESYLDSLLNSVSINNVRSDLKPLTEEPIAEPIAEIQEEPIAEPIAEIQGEPIAEALKDTVAEPADISDQGSEVDDLLSGLLSEIDEGLAQNEAAAADALEPDDIASIFEAQDAAIDSSPETDDEGQAMLEALLSSDDSIFDVASDGGPNDDIVPLDANDDVSPVETVEDINPIEAMEDISPIEAMEDISPVESLDDISPIEGLEDISPVEGLEDISPIEGLEDISSIEALDDISLIETENQAGAVADLASGDGTDSIDNAGLEELLSDITADTDIVDLSMGVDDIFSDVTSISGDITELSIDSADISQIMDNIESSDIEKQLDKLDKDTDKTASKPKKSFFQRIFGNVVEERTPEEEQAYQEKLAAQAAAKEKAAEDKKKKAAQTKEEKAAAAAQAKAEKAEKAKAAAELKAQKKKEADEAKQKKKEEKAAKAAAEAMIDEGRINKIGASILFILMAMILVTIVLLANVYTYKLSISNAETDFSHKKYNEAYYDVYGLQIQDEDIELYDRIMTVMYVNTQLNSYNNYMRLNESEKALDSLLKGLQKYDKYFQLASILNIEDDLAYVRQLILEELTTTFNMTEADAYDIIALSEPIDYSEYIYNLLGEYEVNK